MPKDRILTYHQTHPPDLATIDDLKVEGLQPADSQAVAALFRVRNDDHEWLTGLFRRADAVPLQVKEQA
ncbi:hypothetical protein [Deinococcus aquatilis]|jgi:hypothetical protein|uniref:hypothetical protein n=1 Tax=Deinococcus aquatilis TaxID=519440 RepID=UPI000378EA58|nr:hypothetical protein [Deinococcus aquatilis]